MTVNKTIRTFKKIKITDNEIEQVFSPPGRSEMMDELKIDPKPTPNAS